MNKEYQYPLFDDEGKVVCQICGKSFLVISPRHLSKHKIQYSDYTKRYPDAPLSSDQFNVKSKYGKEKGFFVDENVDNIIADEESIYVEEDTDFDELNLDEVIQKQLKHIQQDPMKIQKAKIFDHLRTHFINVEKDYLIREISQVSNKLLFEFITDFCDPVLRIIIQFPNTFWHNKDTIIDPLKNQKLQEQGWKILEINSRAPSTEDIDSAIDSM
jgi:uncharacterized Zn finger protein (UPF0148 family)